MGYIKIALIVLSGLLTGFLMTKLIDLLEKKKTGEDRHVNKRIFRVLLISIANGLGWLGTALIFGFGYNAIQTAVTVSVCILLAVIDIDIRKIPNEIIIFLFVFSLCFIVFNNYQQRILMHLLGLSIGFLLLLIPFAFGKKAGGGDIKYVSVMGFALGYPKILTALLFMCGALFVWLIWLLATKKGGLKTKIAMAPFISIGFIIAMLTSDVIKLI